ncbi:MAG: TerB family tellurite resistance protein [Capnocytophaga sp.]|nr:TerB family tellurite resistance protein [Capnocytophaga sp.]
MKWIFAVLGFLIYRLPGAIAGYMIGMAFDAMRKGGAFQIPNGQPRPEAVSQGDFELHLLSLCSVVIRANGQVSQAELDFVRNQFVRMYGRERANAVFRKFNELVKGKEISAGRIAYYLRIRTNYEVRLQILHFLFGIAQADGSVSESEVRQIEEIANYFAVFPNDFASIKAMFVQSQSRSADAYTILEIDRTATDAEVKKAYRDMAKKYHPDKVITQDEAIKKGAEEKFKQVQLAYEQIMKERG